jgi:hypothetical protein
MGLSQKAALTDCPELPQVTRSFVIQEARIRVKRSVHRLFYKSVFRQVKFEPV